MSLRSQPSKGALVAIAALLLSLFATSSATTQEPGDEPPPPTPESQVVPGGFDLDPLPGYEQYAGCPMVNQGSTRLCLAVTVSGTIDLGDVSGEVEDLHLVLGVGSNGLNPPTIVKSNKGTPPAPVEQSGGILGQPDLDPVIELDTLNLLGLSATPHLGDLQNTGLTEFVRSAAVNWTLFGHPDGDGLALDDDPIPLGDVGEPFGFLGEVYPRIDLTLPLRLQLNNALLGKNCNIGPFDVSLTNGTTAPPEGVEPMSGSNGSLTYNRQGIPEFHVDGMRFVGNEFAVPGSDCGGAGDLGTAVENLGVDNPFESVVDDKAGLPSPAGNNVADLTVDFHVAQQSLVYGLPVSMDPPGNFAFGDVPVGEAVEQTLTMTNIRNSERTLRVVAHSLNSFTVVSDGCNGVPLAPGESCELVVRFQPQSAKTWRNNITLLSSGKSELVDHTFVMIGTGV